MSKPKAIFLRNNDGPLHVRVEAVMNILTALADSISLTFFGKSKSAYMPVTDAIKWCEEEGRHHNKEKYEKMVRTMKKQLEIEKERDDSDE